MNYISKNASNPKITPTHREVLLSDYPVQYNSYIVDLSNHYHDFDVDVDIDNSDESNAEPEHIIRNTESFFTKLLKFSFSVFLLFGSALILIFIAAIVMTISKM